MDQDYSYHVTQRFLFVVDRLLGKRGAGKITQEKLGNDVGISSSNINRLRNDPSRSVTLEACCRICDIYKVSPSWLLLDIGEMFGNAELQTAYELLEKRVTILEDRMMAVEAVNKIVNKTNKKK